MKNHILKVFSMVILLTNLLLAEQHTVDVRNFNISGIKLGMTKEECINAIISKYKISKSKIRQSANRAGNIHTIYFRKDPMDIEITFDRLELKVEKILFGMADENGNAEAVYKKAIKKYGKPTVDYHNNGGEVSWCKNPIKFSTGISCNANDRNTPVLSILSAIVKLTDPQYQKNFMRKQQEDASAPSF